VDVKESAVQAFNTHRGIIAPLDRANVDTDQIIPKQFLKSIARTGFGDALFFDWRYASDGSPDPGFELNADRFRNASILVTRNNFGCGSSREHAVWAVMQAGFRAVIAPRIERDGGVVKAFADIFQNNASKNGLVTVELSEAEVDEIFACIARFPALEATVDLVEQRVVLHMDEEESYHFDVDPAIKENIVRGLDEIGQTLEHARDIDTYEQAHG
jgi:3-isopropylmalate/(R)-2-methylmalate dehydratase small subunit